MSHCRELVNAVYYPSWRVYKDKPPSSLAVQNVTHIFYAFVRVGTDGTFRLLDEYGDLIKPVDGERGCLRALSKLKCSNPHIRTILSVGGGSGSAEFPELAASLIARTNFANCARVYCDLYGFDGLDIDWEHPKSPVEGAHFLELLKAVRQTLPRPKYLLTSALPVGEYCLKNFDLAAVAAELDYLNLMGYDFTGGWTEVAGHHAQLLSPGEDDGECHPVLRKSCSSGVNYLLSKGFPREKILLGVPTYARYFPNANEPSSSFTGAGEADYCDLPDEWVQFARVDTELVAAAYMDDCGGKGFVSFDVPETVTMKAKFVKHEGLGGMFYWTGVSDREGDQSLVSAGYRELRGE